MHFRQIVYRNKNINNDYIIYQYYCNIIINIIVVLFNETKISLNFKKF